MSVANGLCAGDVEVAATLEAIWVETDRSLLVDR
jgi:hypothetical protein